MASEVGNNESVERALTVLRAFTAGRTELRVSDVAKATGLSLSTVSPAARHPGGGRLRGSRYQRTNNDPTTMLKDFTVQVRTGAGWQQVASLVDNTEPRVTIRSVNLTADQVRLSISDPSRSTTDVARVFEVEVYARP